MFGREELLSDVMKSGVHTMEHLLVGLYHFFRGLTRLLAVCVSSKRAS